MELRIGAIDIGRKTRVSENARLKLEPAIMKSLIRTPESLFYGDILQDATSPAVAREKMEQER